MVWLWARNEQRLRLETRYDNDALEFVMTVEWPDGTRNVERFAGVTAFRARLVEMERLLESERWMHDGPPVILTSGWPQQRQRPD
jgi:hypothetical protein